MGTQKPPARKILVSSILTMCSSCYEIIPKEERRDCKACGGWVCEKCWREGGHNKHEVSDG